MFDSCVSRDVKFVFLVILAIHKDHEIISLGQLYGWWGMQILLTVTEPSLNQVYEKH